MVAPRVSIQTADFDLGAEVAVGGVERSLLEHGCTKNKKG